ncbi:glycosyltransferase family 8 protein [Oxalobacteraceae bacterium A2-2]
MDRLVVFVTDIGFLVPSLVAARQLVKQGIHAIADIVIYTVNIEPELIEYLVLQPGNAHIKFESLPYELFAPPENISFHKNHVPVTSLARLSLHEVIDARYENIIYIDGDVQVVGDVSGLVKYTVPEHMIMAGRGSAWLDLDDGSTNITPDDYLRNLGGLTSETYFNAGVLAFRRSTWVEAAPRALKFFFDNSEICIRHDQSALNATFKDKVLSFAPRYNFHSVYADLHVQRDYPPAIIHFTGPKKPWGAALAPWGARFKPSYEEIMREQPKLQPYLKVVERSSLRAHLRLAKSWLQEWRRLSRDRAAISSQRSKFFDYVRGASFPF